MRIDHVILAVRDLEAFAERLWKEFGLASMPGGVHPRWGTANRIVPVGFAYLELVAVVDPETAQRATFGSWILGSLEERGEGPAGWVVAVDDVGTIAERLDLEIVEGSRVRPDGTRITFLLAGQTEAAAEPWLPFFIQWGSSSFRPSSAEVTHRVTTRDVAWLEVAGEPERLHRWVGTDRFPVRWADGPLGLHRVAVATAQGELVLE